MQCLGRPSPSKVGVDHGDATIQPIDYEEGGAGLMVTGPDEAPWCLNGREDHQDTRDPTGGIDRNDLWRRKIPSLSRRSTSKGVPVGLDWPLFGVGYMGKKHPP